MAQKSPILSKYDPACKTCPRCYRVSYNAVKVCPSCSYQFYGKDKRSK